MDAATTRSLVAYINEYSTRFYAHPLHFGDRVWMIVRDEAAPKTAPCEYPILDAQEYLYRPQRYAPLNDELRSLLETWLERRRETRHEYKPQQGAGEGSANLTAPRRG